MLYCNKAIYKSKCLCVCFTMGGCVYCLYGYTLCVPACRPIIDMCELCMNHCGDQSVLGHHAPIGREKKSSVRVLTCFSLLWCVGYIDLSVVNLGSRLFPNRSQIQQENNIYYENHESLIKRKDACQKRRWNENRDACQKHEHTQASLWNSESE